MAPVAPSVPSTLEEEEEWRRALGRLLLLLLLLLDHRGILWLLLLLLLLKPAEVQGHRWRNEEDRGEEERRGTHGAFLESGCREKGEVFPYGVCV